LRARRLDVGWLNVDSGWLNVDSGWLNVDSGWLNVVDSGSLNAYEVVRLRRAK
jgi:hypothetical protein